MTTEIPSGYMQDSQGRLVPNKMVKPVDRERDKLVQSLIGIAKTEQGRLGKLRSNATERINKFIDKALKKYGAEHGGKKGNVSLISFDGNMKVTISIGNEILFNENLQVAKKLIDECLQEWCEGSRPELQVVIDQAFQTNDDGSLSASRILALRKLSIKDRKWNRAMRALNESIETGTKKPYLRFYEKDADGEWQHISLDIAKVAAN